MPLDALSPIPRYQQIARIIRDQIESGQLRPGDRIPSQQYIQDEYAVAKATAGKALRVLVDEGLVVVVPGMGARVTRRLTGQPQAPEGQGWPPARPAASAWPACKPRS